MSAYEMFLSLVGHHTVQIYGDYGTGKSRFVHKVAKETQSLGRKVLYLDTEGSLSEGHVKELRHYEYLGDDLETLVKRVERAKNEKDQFDLLIIDSIGLPVLNAYARWRLDKKLGAIQKLAPIMADTVRFARDGKGLSIVTNQCVSEFTRVSKKLSEEEPLAPFGGKISFVPKLILRSEPLIRDLRRSEFRLLVFKARNLPRNFEVARFTIDAGGVKIDWKVPPKEVEAGNQPPRKQVPAQVVKPPELKPGKLSLKVIEYNLKAALGMPLAEELEMVDVVESADGFTIELTRKLTDKEDYTIGGTIEDLGGAWEQKGLLGRWRIPKEG